MNQPEPRNSLQSRLDFLEFTPTAIGNAIAVIFSFNLYVFWAKTNIRRYIWRTTDLHGEPFLYSGQGEKLTVGFFLTFVIFLIIFGYPMSVAVNFMDIDPNEMAIPDAGIIGNIIVGLFLPVFVMVIGLTVTYLPRFEVTSVEGSIAVAVLIIGISLLLSASRFMNYRYLLNHTHWAETRGAIKGSPWRYAFRIFPLEASVWLTLGWTSPWRFCRRYEFIFENASLAGHPISLDTQPKKLLLPFAVCWTAIGLISISQWVINQFGIVWSIPAITAYAIASVILVIYALAWYNARVFGHIAESMTLGSVRFRFSATGTDLFLLYFTNLAMNLVSIGLSFYFSRLRIARFMVNHIEVHGDVIPDYAAGSTTAARETLGEGADILWPSSYF